MDVDPHRHICFVDSLRSWGGAEVWLLETAVALRARGVRASIVAQPAGELRQRARAAGVPAAAVPIRCDGAPWTIARLARHFRRAGVTTLLANRTKDLKACVVAGPLGGVRRVYNTRESDFPLKNKAYYRWYFRRASGLIVASEATRRTLLAGSPWLDPGRIHLLPKGIDTDRFHPAAAPPQVPTVGFLGQLIARKGVPELMAAWSRIDAAERDPRPRLRIAGEGVLRDDVVRWRAGLRHPAAVALAGFVEDPASFLRGLTVLAMPSHAEGFGLAAAEALACGVPVVAGDASSLPEIVTDGATGLLVPPGDADALAAALAELLDDPPRARDLGRSGRRDVVARFHRETTLDRLLRITSGPRTTP